MTYEFYKILHVYTVILLLIGISLSLWGHSSKILKMSNGVLTLLVFVAGMGLLARLGIPHDEPWAWWVRGKVLIWLILVVGGPMVVKRRPQWKTPFFYLLIAATFGSVYLAILKPA